MKVHVDLDGWYWEDPQRHWNFEAYAHLGPDDVHLFIGQFRLAEKVKDLPGRKYLIAIEEQSRPTGPQDSHDRECLPWCDKLFTFAPLAVKLQRRTYAYIPFNEEKLPENLLGPAEKKYDVVYCGNIFTGRPYFDEIFNTMPKFDHRLVSFQAGPHVTNPRMTYVEKLNVINQCRVTISHNLAAEDSPQLKTRPFEAAFCKSLMLSHRAFGKEVLEPWFEEGKHFLYYDNLEETLTDVLANYDQYHTMIEETYDYAMNRFTCKHFVEDFVLDGKLEDTN